MFDNKYFFPILARYDAIRVMGKRCHYRDLHTIGHKTFSDIICPGGMSAQIRRKYLGKDKNVQTNFQR